MRAQKTLFFFLFLFFGFYSCFGNTYCAPVRVGRDGYLCSEFSPNRSSSSSVIKQVFTGVASVLAGVLSIFGGSGDSLNSNSYKKNGHCQCGKRDCPNAKKKEPLSAVQQLYNQGLEENYPLDNSAAIAHQNTVSYTPSAKSAAQTKQKKPQKTEKQKKKEQEEQKRSKLKNKKIVVAQEVQPVFIEKIPELEDAATFFYEKAENENVWVTRYEQRTEAIQKALDNHFYVEYKTYTLADHTQQLLTRHQIDIRTFEHCAGNAIQQQIHAEFVTVLNSGAGLHKSENVQHLTENWFSTLGGFSVVGSNVNTAGQFSLAHTISDICNGLYEIAKNGTCAQYQGEVLDYEVDQQIISATVHYFKKVFTCPGEVSQDIKYVAKRVGGSISDFTPGVKRKALRPICAVAQFSHELKHNPNLAYKKASKFVFERAEEFLNTDPMLRAMSSSVNYFRSENIEQFLIDEFEKGYALPFQKQIEAAAHTFWQMPRKEKAQEIVALGAQVITVIAAVQLTTAMVTAATAEVALAKTAILLNLEKFFRLAEPVMRTGISPGGGASMVIEIAEPLSEEFVAVMEEAAAIVTSGNAVIVSPAAVETAGNMLFALSENVSGSVGVGVGSAGGTPPPSPQNHTNITTEEIEAIGDGKIEVIPRGKNTPVRIKIKNRKLQPKHSLCPSHKKMEKLIKRFKEKIGTPECFEQVGIRKIKKVDRLLKHSLGMEHQYKVTRSGVKQIDKGMHFLHQGRLVDTDAINIQNQCVHPVTKVVKCDIFMNGQWTPKTLWPVHWRSEQVVDKIIESICNIRDALINNGRIILEGKTNCGVKIRTVLELDGRGVSVYPMWD